MIKQSNVSPKTLSHRYSVKAKDPKGKWSESGELNEQTDQEKGGGVSGRKFL